MTLRLGRLHHWGPVFGLASGLLAGLAGLAQAQSRPEFQQARLDAQYVVTLAGIPLGEGTWTVDVGADRFSAAASGKTTGVVQFFSSGRGTSEARGSIRNSQLIPARYATWIKSGRKSEDLRIRLDDGAVKEVSIMPPPPPKDQPGRIPVTEAHRRNVRDPMSGALIRVAGSGDLMAPDACKQHAPIFDGRMRYDLTLAFKRIEQVKVPGYQGPALVCAVYFAPLAGHVPSRAAIKYLVQQRDMEAWLVPITGTRVLVPFKFTVPTPLGLGVLQATQFNVTPVQDRAGLNPQ